MTQCKICGSHAFNLRAEGIDQGELCDRHYYQDALAAKTADFDRLCKDFDRLLSGSSERELELTRIIAGLRADLAQAKLYTPGRRAEAMPKTEHGPCNFNYFGVETDEEFAASGKPYVEVTE